MERVKTCKISLRDWINEVGAETIAKLIKIDRSAVYHWRRGKCLPSSRQMASITKFSKGSIDWTREISRFHRN